MNRTELRAWRRPVWAAALAVSVLGGCAGAGIERPVATAMLVSDRLFLGRSIPGGGEVSDQEWERFVREVATPLFPNGMTVWRAQGQWRDPAGVLFREPVMVIEIIHRDTAEANRSLAVVAQTYKTRFSQQEILRVTNRAEIRPTGAPDS